jgi:hypothetical protein
MYHKAQGGRTYETIHKFHYNLEYDFYSLGTFHACNMSNRDKR